MAQTNLLYFSFVVQHSSICLCSCNNVINLIEYGTFSNLENITPYQQIHHISHYWGISWDISVFEYTICIAWTTLMHFCVYVCPIAYDYAYIYKYIYIYMQNQGLKFCLPHLYINTLAKMDRIATRNH